MMTEKQEQVRLLLIIDIISKIYQKSISMILGDKVLYMLQRLNAKNLVVIVTRWFGGKPIFFFILIIYPLCNSYSDYIIKNLLLPTQRNPIGK